MEKDKLTVLTRAALRGDRALVRHPAVSRRGLAPNSEEGLAPLDLFGDELRSPARLLGPPADVSLRAFGGHGGGERFRGVRT